ncbi:Tfp pilus assembly protein FimT/FimU [Candidatus Margulisiibacteriota bacterium]
MKSQRAFTLIELVMVIALLGILAVASFVAIGSFQSQHLNAAAERVAADLRYAKNLALTKTVWHGVIYNTGTEVYEIYQTDGTTDTLIKKPEDLNQDFSVDLDNDYDGVGISSADIDSGSKVEFDPYGVPFTDKNGNAITSVGIITLSGGGSSVTVRIAPETGRVYIQ